MRLTGFVLLLILPMMASSQLSDFLSVQKRKGGTVKNFIVGSPITFITTSGNVVEGIIKQLRNDTVTVLNYNVRQYQTDYGAVLFDTLSFISVNNYKEIAGVYIFRNRGWGQRRIASVLMAGGAGYFILNLVNTAYRKEDMGSKENLTTLVGSTVAFGVGWLLKRNAPSGFTGKRYEIKYMNMQ